MVKCVVLGEKDNHPYLMILFVCLILCSPESHPHSTSIQLASLPVLSAFFMGQSVRFSSREWILSSTATPSGRTIFPPQNICFVTKQSRWNFVDARERKTDQCKGSERSSMALSYVYEIRKATCQRAWTVAESMAGRDGHLAQKVSGSSPCPWLVFTVILSSTLAKNPAIFQAAKVTRIDSAKWCHVPRLWTSSAPLWSWGCLIRLAANCSKMKVPW